MKNENIKLTGKSALMKFRIYRWDPEKNEKHAGENRWPVERGCHRERCGARGDWKNGHGRWHWLCH